ncbi:MAG: ABC transporter permease [Symploca sp. SIO2G7]|nr:ABC transporter permease [Symploca sp. SIO2G7]
MNSKICLDRKKFIVPLIALIVFLSAWELSTHILSISPLILPSPSLVAKTLIEKLGYLITQGSVTLLESVLGFLLGCLAAVVLATIFLFSKTAQQAIYPYAIALKGIPLVALAPLAVLWFGTGLFSKILLAAIISFFPILVNTVEGLRSVEAEALELMATLSASPMQVFQKLRLPSALSSLFAGMKVSSTFSVVGAVVAEFIGSQNGIGYVIKSSSYYLDTDLTFAAIIVTALISLTLFWLIEFLERKFIFWKTNNSL